MRTHELHPLSQQETRKPTLDGRELIKFYPESPIPNDARLNPVCKGIDNRRLLWAARGLIREIRSRHSWLSDRRDAEATQTAEALVILAAELTEAIEKYAQAWPEPFRKLAECRMSFPWMAHANHERRRAADKFLEMELRLGSEAPFKKGYSLETPGNRIVHQYVDQIRQDAVRRTLIRAEIALNDIDVPPSELEQLAESFPPTKSTAGSWAAEIVRRLKVDFPKPEGVSGLMQLARAPAGSDRANSKTGILWAYIENKLKRSLVDMIRPAGTHVTSGDA